MRVVFPRLPDEAKTYAIAHRDDGVTYRVRGNGQRCGSEPPHDLSHFVVERALRLASGFWGCVADGVVFSSMTHLSGRRPPQAAPTSRALMRERHRELGYAELMVWLAEQIVRRGVDEDDLAMRRLTAQALSTLPEPYPEPAEMRTCTAALREAMLQWQSLRPGEELHLTWPPARSRRPSAREGRDDREGRTDRQGSGAGRRSSRRQG